MAWTFHLLCIRCSKPILPPTPKHGQRLPPQSWSSTGNWPKNILCPSCKHVCSYGFELVQPKYFPDTDPEEPRPHRKVFYAEFPCSESGCAFPVRILAIASVEPRMTMQ